MRPPRRTLCPVTKKIQYAKELDAKIALFKSQAAQRKGDDNRGECRYYQCPRCRQWHLTSRK